MMFESFEAELSATSVLDTLRRNADVSAHTLDPTGAAPDAIRCSEPRTLLRSFLGAGVLSAMLTSMGACAGQRLVCELLTPGIAAALTHQERLYPSCFRNE